MADIPNTVCQNDPKGQHRPVEIEDDGETVCEKCGVVLEDHMLSFTGEPTHDMSGFLDNSQNGGPSKLSIHDRGLTTVMGKKNSDSSGNKITGKNRSELSRLRIWDSRTKRKQKDNALTKAFTILKTVSSQNRIPDGVSEDAAFVCRKAMVKNIAKGRSITEVIGACIYIACRRTDFPKTLDEVAASIGISKKRLSRTFRKVVFSLDLQLDVPNPEKYLPRICNNLNVSEKTKRLAFEILTVISKQNGYIGAKPNLISAASIYHASVHYGEEITQHGLAIVADTSTISLRKYIHDERFKKAIETLTISLNS